MADIKYEEKPSKAEILSKLDLIFKDMQDAVENDRPFMINFIINEDEKKRYQHGGFGYHVDGKMAMVFISHLASKINGFRKKNNYGRI